MQKPVILTVDDDPEVLRAIERDLKKHYEDRYRVLRADSGRAALDLLRRLQQRNNAVALLLVARVAPHGVDQFISYGWQFLTVMTLISSIAMVRMIWRILRRIRQLQP